MAVAAPSIIDRVRSAFTGTAAEVYAVRRFEQRGQAAKLLENYDYASSIIDLVKDRFADGWLPLGIYPGKDSRRAGRSVPVVFNETNLDFYRNSARLLYETDDHAGGLIDRLVDYECGRGFQWTAYLSGKKPGDEPEHPLTKAAQAALDAFRKRDRFRSREREISLRGHRDGEAFLRLFRSRPGRPPALRTVEPEWVVRPNCAPDEYGPFSFGILTHADDIEKPLAYHVRDPNNPGVDGEIVLAGGLLPDEEAEARQLIAELVGERVPIGPGRVYHYKRNVDRTVKRGLPTFRAAAAGYNDAAKLLRNIVGTAGLQAAIYLIRRHTGGTAEGLTKFVTDNIANSGNMLQSTARASVGGVLPRSVPTGAQGGPVVIDSSGTINYESGPVSSGVPGFLEAHLAQLRKGGCRVGAPEYLSTGDASNGNYASTKEAGSPFVVATEGRQQDLADFEESLAEDVLLMSIPETGVPFTGVCVSVQPPAVAIRSELDVENQRQVQHQNGVLSARTWQQQAGLKPEVEEANFAAERDANPDGGPGLQVPNWFGGGGQESRGGRTADDFFFEVTDDSGHKHDADGKFSKGSGSKSGSGNPGTTKKPAGSKPSAHATNSVKDYTEDHFQTVNGQLRGNEPMTPATQKMVAGVDEYLEKSPKYDKASIRSFSVPADQVDAFAAKLEVGGVFSDPAFVSTRKTPTMSDRAGFVQGLAPHGQVILKVSGQSGVDISHLSKNPGEGEVLYPRGTQFRVKAMKRTDAGGILAELEEIPASKGGK